MAGDLHRVAHHVGEHAATLLVALPEPGHVRAGMLLRRAREIGPAGERHGAAPDDLLAALDGGREHLVLQVACGEPGVVREPDHGAGFCQSYARVGFSQATPRSRLPPFTALWIASIVATRVSLGERIQSASTSFARISLSSEAVGGAGAQAERVGARGERGAVLLRRAVDPGDGAVAHAGEGFEVEARDEARADHPDTQRLQRLALGHGLSLLVPSACQSALWHLIPETPTATRASADHDHGTDIRVRVRVRA